MIFLYNYITFSPYQNHHSLKEKMLGKLENAQRGNTSGNDWLKLLTHI